MADEAIVRIILQDTGGGEGAPPPVSPASPPSTPQGQSPDTSQSPKSPSTPSPGSSAGTSQPPPAATQQPPPASQGAPPAAPPPPRLSTADVRAADAYREISSAVDLASKDVETFNKATEGVQGKLFQLRYGIDPKTLADLFANGSDAATALIDDLREIDDLLQRGAIGTAEGLALAKRSLSAAVDNYEPPTAPQTTAPTDPTDAQSTDWLESLISPEKGTNPHVLLEGQSGSGKSVATRHIAMERMKRGHEVNVLDPHTPESWGGARQVFQGESAGTEAAKFMEDLLKSRIAERQEALSKGEQAPDFKPVTMVLSDFAAIAKNTPALQEIIKQMLTEGRKFNIAIMADTTALTGAESGIQGINNVLANFRQKARFYAPTEDDPQRKVRIGGTGGEMFPVPNLPDYKDKVDYSLVKPTSETDTGSPVGAAAAARRKLEKEKYEAEIEAEYAKIAPPKPEPKFDALAVARERVRKEEERQAVEEEYRKLKPPAPVVEAPFDPVELAKKRIEAEKKRALVDAEYRKLKPEVPKSGTDSFLEAAESLRGVLGGTFGKIVGAVLDITAHMRRARERTKETLPPDTLPSVRTPQRQRPIIPAALPAPKEEYGPFPAVKPAPPKPSPPPIAASVNQSMVGEIVGETVGNVLVDKIQDTAIPPITAPETIAPKAAAAPDTIPPLAAIAPATVAPDAAIAPATSPPASAIAPPTIPPEPVTVPVVPPAATVLKPAIAPPNPLLGRERTEQPAPHPFNPLLGRERIEPAAPPITVNVQPPEPPTDEPEEQTARLPAPTTEATTKAAEVTPPKTDDTNAVPVKVVQEKEPEPAPAATQATPFTPGPKDWIPHATQPGKVPTALPAPTPTPPPAAGTGAAAGGGMMAGAAAAVPYVAAALAIKQMVSDALKGGIQGIGNVAKTFSSPDDDPARALESVSQGMSDLGDKLPGVGLALTAVGEAGKVVAGLMDNFNKMADKYAQYNPAIAQAQAQAEIRRIMGDMSRAQRSGEELARYIQAQSEMQQRWEEIKMKIWMKILPVLTGIMEVIGRFLRIAESRELDRITDPTSIILNQAALADVQFGATIPMSAPNDVIQ